MKFKKHLRWVGTTVLAWVFKKILDSTGVYENIEGYFTSQQGKENFLNFFNYSLPLWKIILFAALLIIGYVLISVIFRNYFGKEAKLKKKKEEENERLLRLQKRLQANTESVVDGNQLLIRYNVVFRAGMVDLTDLVPYCNLHETPLRMNYNTMAYEIQCADNYCRNRFSHMPLLGNNPMDGYRSQILSRLEVEWRKLQLEN